MGIADRIRSLQDMVTERQYVKPSPEKLEMFKKNLFESEIALSYLKIDRGLAEDTIKHFNLGYDIERNAIAIPIFKNQELINIRYRLIAPKEKQSKYTQEKDCEVWLYNDTALDVALKRGAVLVTEGEFDCMASWQAGIPNVVSPASGKDSYGVWLELLEPIASVYIAYDNDKAGKEASYKFAERIGIEKCKEITYPDGIKDANEFFKTHTRKDFLELYKESRPFYTRKYNDLFDVIKTLREDNQEKLEIDIIPDVKLTPDHLITMAGGTNAGKTMYALNVAKRLVEKGIPTLVLPFERGIASVGGRFIQILMDKTEDEMKHLSSDDWEKMIKKISSLPAYFAMPRLDELEDIISKASKILGIKAVVVDHLDMMIRGGSGTEESAIRESMHRIKSMAIAHNIMMFIVTHTRRVHQAGAEGKKKPTMHDIRGSTAIEQDSETVVMIDKASDDEMEIDIQKNKGKMSNVIFKVDYATGLIGEPSNRARSLDDF